MQSPLAVDTLKRLTDGRLRRAEEGQDLLAYGLLGAALIAVAAIAAFWSAIANTF